MRTASWAFVIGSVLLMAQTVNVVGPTETGVTALPVRLDPRGALARAMNVPGLPVTVLLNREGAEIARLMGGADWNSPAAVAIIDYLAALPG